MAISGDIEKLERRWLENPSGLMFAPLAEAHRKAGNHERALEILDSGLVAHADYVPALIVRGRCFLDASLLNEAEQAFERALERDPVNAIALRGIAEAYELTGRPAEAIERLELLLEVDRGDRDAMEALERVRQAAATHSDPETEPLAEDQPTPEVTGEGAHAPYEWSESEVDRAPEETASWVPSAEMLAEPAEDESESADLAIDPPQEIEVESVSETLDVESDDSPDAAATLDDPVVEEVGATDDPWAEWRGPMAESVSEGEESDDDSMGQWGEPAEENATEEALPEADPVDTDPVSSFSSSWASWASWSREEASDGGTPDESPVKEAKEEPAPEVPATAEAEEESEELVSEVEDDVDEVSPEETPALIVTESMAELFLQQGHRELALAVYRQLASRPDHDHLDDTIASLERELADLAEADSQGDAAERQSFVAASTGGRPVAEYLRAVLDSPPPSVKSNVLPPAIETGPDGEPTRESDQPFSLASVFGERAPSPTAIAGAEGSPTLPSPSGDVSSPPGDDDEPSYDEFFGGTAPAADTESTAGSAPPSDAEDLHQFNEWLKGLKR